MNKISNKVTSVVVSIALTLGFFTSAGASSKTALQLGALNYYVSAGGSDINNCTQQTTPCKSFNKAMSLAKAGDVIHIIGTIPSVFVTKSGLTIEGGTVDGIADQSPNNPAFGIDANNITVRNVEIINGWSYGLRTGTGFNGLVLDNVTIHNNVLENKLSTGGCNGNNTHGWGSGFRAYYSTNIVVKNSRIYDNCGEGFSSVMSSNVTGINLEIYDNFSVNVYPDQSQNFTVSDSIISCIKPEYQRYSLSAALLLGAENYSGISTNVLDGVVFERNKVYNCKGVQIYSETTNSWKNVRIANNEFYNVPSPAIVSISGTNIVLSPNVIASSPTGAVSTRTNTPAPVMPSPTPSLIPAVPSQTPVQLQPTAPGQTSTTLSAGQNVFEARVSKGVDDVEESATGWMYLDSTDLELVYDSDNQLVGMRFTGVNVPKGATITKAYIQFKVDETTSVATTLSIRGEASPNASAFTSASRNLSSRLKTKSSVNWSPASWLKLGAGQQTPDLAPIVQEIVNQAGWTGGNAMILMVTGKGSRVAESFETSSAGAPLLHIEYSIPAAASSSSILLPTATPTAVFTLVSPTVTPLVSITNTIAPSPTPTAAPSETPIPPTPAAVSTETPIPSTPTAAPTEISTEVPATP